MAAWSGALRSLFEPLLTFAPPEDVYLTYGKLFCSCSSVGWRVSGSPRPTNRKGRTVEKWAFVWPLLGLCWARLEHRRILDRKRLAGSRKLLVLAFLVPARLLFNLGFPLFGFGTLRAKVGHGWEPGC